MEENRTLELLELGFPKLGRACVFFALFFVFCRFENPVGILYPVSILSLEAAYLFFYKKMGEPVKKDSYFYLGAAALLGISTCITDNWVIQYFNRIAIWLLFGVTCLHNSYRDEGWHVSTYVRNLFALAFAILGNFFVLFRCQQEKQKKEPGEKNEEKRKLAVQILAGVLIAVVLLAVILPLLSEADAVFQKILSDLFGNLFRGILIPARFLRAVMFFIVMVLFSFSSAYTLHKKGLREDQSDKRSQSPVVALTFTSILAFVYVFFCGLQLVVLLIGARLPERYTYSAYAREGFFQLLFVCVINLAVVLICVGLFQEHKMLKILLTVISACTYFLTGLAYYRMMLYIGAYGLTRLRVLTLAALLAVAILLAGLIFNIYDYEFPLFRFSVAVVTCIYVLLSLSRMDAWIADYNLNRNVYKFELSADFAPAMEKAIRNGKMQEEQAQRFAREFFSRMNTYENENFRTFNFSHYQGKKAAEAYFKALESKR